MRSIKEIEQFLDEAIVNYMQSQAIPGIALGVILDGQLAYSRGYGTESIDSNESVTERSMFHSASISKTFVATSLMQLYERKLLNLDSAVIEYLPYFKLKDKRYKDITVGQMMSHISGMPDVYDYEWDNPQKEDDALENYVKSIYDFELLWEPGKGYSYSNLAYEILGDVIAKVSGLTFEDYVKQNILQPLGMANSSFLIDEVPKDIMTSPHVLSLVGEPKPIINEFYPYNRIHAPSSTLWSSVEELARYAIANLNKGSFGNFQMLKQETYNLMWKPYAETNRKGTNVGLSWFIKDYKGAQLIFHTGGDTGYTSNLILIPEHNAALVFYCNCDYINLNLVIEHILDVIMGFEVQKFLTPAMFEIAQVLASSGMIAALKHFDEIRNLKRNNYYISEVEFNRLAYQCLKQNKLDEAIAVLNMAISEVPDAANLYDSLGEMYLYKGNREQAIENYKKSLELNPQNASGIAALKKMGIEL